MVNYTEAFERPFTDIKKLLIGIAFSILPIISWFAIGFFLECSGVGKTKAGKKMPEWKNLGSLFLKGFISFVISLVYFALAMLVFLIGAGAAVFSLIKAIPWNQVINATSEQASAIVNPIIQDAAPSVMAALPFIITAVVLAVLAAYVLPIALLSYISGDSFNSAFKLKSIFKKAFTGKYFVAWILMIVISLLLGGILRIIPIIGQPAASFIVGVISYSLFGQIFLENEEKSKKKSK